jgi:hypothetical protein
MVGNGFKTTNIQKNYVNINEIQKDENNIL